MRVRIRPNFHFEAQTVYGKNKEWIITHATAAAFCNVYTVQITVPISFTIASHDDSGEVTEETLHVKPGDEHSEIMVNEDEIFPNDPDNESIDK